VRADRDGVAFVLGGGGHHLRRRDNGAVVATDSTPATAARLEAVWSEIDQNGVFDGSIFSRLVTLARTRTHLHGNDALRGLLSERCPRARARGAGSRSRRALTRQRFITGSRDAEPAPPGTIQSGGQSG
jgi:hypothetical protein